jgi:archaellum biogenesis protein FlaJ (TadC family)
MRCLLWAAILTSGAITSVQAEAMFYIVYDKTMHGCTIVTTEPSDKSRYKTEGRYKTEREAERAITSIKEC